MREIRFRAWLIQEKKMAIPSSLNWNKGYGGCLEIFVDNPEFQPYKHIIERRDSGIVPFFSYTNHSVEAHLKNTPHQFILMQFTGLKDKNETDIYEGDILKWKNGAMTGTASISRQPGHFQMDHYIFEDNAMVNPRFFESQTEIIGNIHQNPELL
jgi:hypothetical protein